MKIYTYRSGHKTLKRVLSITLSLLVLVQMTPAAFVVNSASANHGGPYGNNPVEKITLCHDESGDGTSYHSSGGVNVSAALNGHGDHETDIIPPFHYQQGNPNSPVLSYPGLNWNAVNEDIWANGACNGDGIITPPATTGTLTLVKSVVNDDLGAAINTDWTLSANGLTPISGTTGAGSVTNAVVTAGDYDLSESGGPSGYTLTSWSCSGGSMVDVDTVTIEVDGSVTCTATNDDNEPTAPVTGSLIINKVIVNDNGGTGVYTDFSFSVDNGTSTAFESDGSNTISGLSLGSHTVVESAAPGYTTSYSGSCPAGIVIIPSDGTPTCTIVNDDIPLDVSTGTLVIQKIVINDNGGTGTTTGFTFSVNGGSATAFEVDGSNSLVVATGTYNIVETSASGYTTTYEGCSDIALAAGETKTCVVTNNDIAQDTPTDVCSNIEGNQTEVPEGMEQDGDQCVTPDDTTTTSGGGGGGSRRGGGIVLGINNDEPQGQVLGATFEPGLPNTGNGPLNSAETNTLAIVFAGMIALVGLNLASFKALKLEVKSK